MTLRRSRKWPEPAISVYCVSTVSTKVLVILNGLSPCLSCQHLAVKRVIGRGSGFGANPVPVLTTTVGRSEDGWRARRQRLLSYTFLSLLKKLCVLFGFLKTHIIFKRLQAATSDVAGSSLVPPFPKSVTSGTSSRLWDKNIHPTSQTVLKID